MRIHSAVSTMNITCGLFSHMVLNQDASGVCECIFSGTCAHEGEVQAKVTRPGTMSAGNGWTFVGRCVDGEFNCRLRSLPCPGPYDISLRIVNAGNTVSAAEVSDVLVGSVWILAGQSQTKGVGFLTPYSTQSTNASVRAFYMDDRWDIASDPLHNIWEATDKVHSVIQGKPPEKDLLRCKGPGVPFGLHMFELSGIPQGLIPCAHSGTSMQDWSPAKIAAGSESLLGATIRRIKKNGGEIAGVIWVQGEADTTPSDAPLYTQRMKELITHIRQQVGSEALPFVVGQIGRSLNPEDQEAWQSIREQQRLLPDRVDRCAIVPTIDLDLDDTIHLSGESQIRLGRRLADAAWAMTSGLGNVQPTITLEKITLVENPWRGLSVIEVKFANVAGRLVAGSRPSGFAVTDQDGNVIRELYKTELHHDIVKLKVYKTPDQISTMLLNYGLGTDPYCNITDELDRCLPVFGPVPLRRRGSE